MTQGAIFTATGPGELGEFGGIEFGQNNAAVVVLGKTAVANGDRSASFSTDPEDG